MEGVEYYSQITQRPGRQVKGQRQRPGKMTRKRKLPYKTKQSYIPRFRSVSESKFVDVKKTSIAFNGTGSIVLLNGIQLGSAFYNRIGRKVLMKNITLNFDVNLTGTDNVDFDNLRLILLYDARSNGAAPSIADILLATSNDGTTETTSISMIKILNRERFILVRDMHCVGSPVLNVSTATQARTLTPRHDVPSKVFARLNLETEFQTSSNPAVIGDILSGALFLIAFGSYTAGSEAYSAQFTSRIKYTDV